MSDQEWDHDFARSLGMYLSGEALNERDRRGRPIRDDNFIVLFNSHHEALHFALPDLPPGGCWQVLLDTQYKAGLAADGCYVGDEGYELQGRSLVLLMDSQSR